MNFFIRITAKILFFCQNSKYICGVMNEIEGHILDYAGKAGQFSVAQLEDHLRSVQRDVSTSSLYYYLNRMIKRDGLTRLTRGVYSGGSLKSEFKATVTDEMTQVFSILHKALPFADFCLYVGADITPFQHNMAANNILYVETQRDTCDSAFNILKDAGKAVYVRPDKEMINRYVSLSEPAIFVKPLISESPVGLLDNGMKIPMLEKLLVDINADNDFFYLQGEEAFYIFRNAFERYGINEGKLLRYARRRNLEQKMKGYMEDMNI